MSWLDKSCLQLAVRRKEKIETFTFQVELQYRVQKAQSCVQMQSPSVKADWVVEHRLSRLVSPSPPSPPSLPPSRPWTRPTLQAGIS